MTSWNASVARQDAGSHTGRGNSYGNDDRQLYMGNLATLLECAAAFQTAVRRSASRHLAQLTS